MEAIVKLIKLKKFKKKLIFKIIKYDINLNINIFYCRLVAIRHNYIKYIN